MPESGGKDGSHKALSLADYANLGLVPLKEMWDKKGSWDDLMKLLGLWVDQALNYLSEKAPSIEAWLIEALDTIFAPRLLLRHLLAALVLQSGLMAYNGLSTTIVRLLGRLSKKNRALKEARAAMRLSRDYQQWKRAAEHLDELEGHLEWRLRPESLLYNHEVLQSQIDELQDLMQHDDVFGLMFRLRGSLSRNQLGMLHEGLFSRAHSGTKILVENYHEAVCNALTFICTSHSSDIPTDAKLAFFNETRHAYGRTALMLSGGAAMGFYHVGVVKALIEQHMMPRVISGASAGSIMAAMVGTRTDAELKPMYHGEGVMLGFFRPLRLSKREASAANSVKGPSGWGAKWQFLIPPALRWLGDLFWQVVFSNDGLLRMDTDYLRSVVRHNVGSYTFQEAFDRTGRIVNIIVAPRNRTDPPRLLNYLTAPHVLVWSAAVCSSSVPGVFDPSTLLVKEADGSIRPELSYNQKYVDGSMEADLPMQQISELFNINHFLVSQVNPHASLLSSIALPASVWNHPVYSFMVGVVGFLKAQLRNWFKNVLEFVSLRRMAPVWATRRGGIQLLTQEYEGRHCDVTITPWEGNESVLSAFAKMLSNPDRREFSTMVAVSERNTWPKLDMIRCHCAVEMTLEKCVQEMRRRLANENQQEAARLAAHLQAHSANGATFASRLGARVPSFYTSRSIVNLSGLNVLDPTIGHGHRMPDATSHLSLADEDERNEVGLSMENDGRPTTPMRSGLGTPNQSSLGGTAGSFGDMPDWGAVENGGLPGSPKHSREDVCEDEVGSLPPVGNNITKSTSMANFYYRRSKSWDLLSDNKVGANGRSNPDLTTVDSQQDMADGGEEDNGNAGEDNNDRNFAAAFSRGPAFQLRARGLSFGNSRESKVDTNREAPPPILLAPKRRRRSRSSGQIEDVEEDEKESESGR